MAQATARILDSTCAVERGLENERTTPRATFRRGQLSLQSNEIFGRTNPIPKRSRRRANCAQAFVAGPAVFPLYFQRAALPRNPRRGRTIPAPGAFTAGGDSVSPPSQELMVRRGITLNYTPLNCTKTRAPV